MQFLSFLSAILSAGSLVVALPVARQVSNVTDAAVAAASCPPLIPSPACTNPSVRKEWRTLDDSQKASFLSAVKCFGNLPHDTNLVQTGDSPDIPPINPDSSNNDDFVYTHIDLNHRIHSTGFFFTWHRFYISEWEKVLRNQCGYADPLPYWDWTLDTADLFNSDFFDPNPISGVGTWGDPTNDFQIPDGAWGTDQDEPFFINYPSPHAVRRNFTLQPYFDFPFPYLIEDPSLNANETFTQDRVDEAVNNFDGDFQGFQASFQNFQGPHAGVHLIVGADLTGLCPGNAPADCIPGETWSSNDPIFWMHHSRVDKAWADWQNRNPDQNKCAFTGGTVQMLDSLADYQQFPLGGPPNLDLTSILPDEGILQTGVAIQDIMDTTGGYLCYVYE